jgi:hypothetical protein
MTVLPTPPLVLNTVTTLDALALRWRYLASGIGRIHGSQAHRNVVGGLDCRTHVTIGRALGGNHVSKARAHRHAQQLGCHLLGDENALYGRRTRRQLLSRGKSVIRLDGRAEHDHGAFSLTAVSTAPGAETAESSVNASSRSSSVSSRPMNSGLLSATITRPITAPPTATPRDTSSRESPESQWSSNR